MLRSKRPLVAALMATTLLTSGAVWAASPEPATPTHETAATKDYGKLSADGARGFQDLTATRIAIFDGRVDDAKKSVADAESAFGKAKTDDTAFVKAEADLKAPKGQTQPTMTSKDGSADAAKTATTADQMKTPVAWLPVNGAITINEDYTANPAKMAAVSDANKSLKSGDHKAAVEKLKLAGLDIDVTLAVVPMEQTIDDVHQAADLINSGKYYEGSQMLRKVQSSERFDIADLSGLPKATAAATSGSTDHPAPDKGMPAKH